MHPLPVPTRWSTEELCNFILEIIATKYGECFKAAEEVVANMRANWVDGETLEYLVLQDWQVMPWCLRLTSECGIVVGPKLNALDQSSDWAWGLSCRWAMAEACARARGFWCRAVAVAVTIAWVSGLGRSHGGHSERVVAVALCLFPVAERWSGSAPEFKFQLGSFH